jgi:hypothetical protein
VDGLSPTPEMRVARGGGSRAVEAPVRHGLKPAAGTATSPVLARRRLRQTGLQPHERYAQTGPSAERPRPRVRVKPRRASSASPGRHGLKPAAGTATSPVLACRRLRQTGLQPHGRYAQTGPSAERPRPRLRVKPRRASSASPGRHGLKPAAGTATSPVLARRRLRQTGLQPHERYAQTDPLAELPRPRVRVKPRRASSASPRRGLSLFQPRALARGGGGRDDAGRDDPTSDARRRPTAPPPGRCARSSRARPAADSPRSGLRTSPR